MLDLSRKQKIVQAQHWFSSVDQLYHPTGFFGQELSNLVYACDILQNTKFLQILLKELFYLVKKNGYLVLDYRPNELCDWQKLESNMWWLWRKNYEVFYHGPVKKEQEIGHSGIGNKLPSLPDSHFRFVCQKITTMQHLDDSINKWTFGIITNGKRDDLIERILQSIRRQNIPEYEVIICGTYRSRNQADVKYMPFDMRDEKGWISKKKNLIAGNARFNNLCIMHDRLFLHQGWFAGMKKYGNTFEAITCRQVLDDGDRAGDWLTTNGRYNKKTAYFQQYKIELLNYRDWDFWAYLGGQLTIIKKHVWKEIPWNETLYWNDGEDVDLSLRLQQSGKILRVNPDAVVKTIAWRHGKLPEKGSKQFMIRKIVRISMYFVAQIPGSNFLLQLFWQMILKSKPYEYVKNH